MSKCYPVKEQEKNKGGRFNATAGRKKGDSSLSCIVLQRCIQVSAHKTQIAPMAQLTRKDLLCSIGAIHTDDTPVLVVKCDKALLSLAVGLVEKYPLCFLHLLCSAELHVDVHNTSSKCMSTCHGVYKGLAECNMIENEWMKSALTPSRGSDGQRVMDVTPR